MTDEETPSRVSCLPDGTPSRYLPVTSTVDPRDRDVDSLLLPLVRPDRFLVDLEKKTLCCMITSLVFLLPIVNNLWTIDESVLGSLNVPITIKGGGPFVYSILIGVKCLLIDSESLLS